MYMALGMLHWKDVDETPYASPLLLVPVQFVTMGRKNRPHLRINVDEDPTLNPALALRLAEFGVTLPNVDDLSDLSVEDGSGPGASGSGGQARLDRVRRRRCCRRSRS